jgi:hypothetical protein
MQNADQYRRFAEILAAAAQSAPPETRDILLNAAQAWGVLADGEAPERAATGDVVDLAQARRRLRSA